MTQYDPKAGVQFPASTGDVPWPAPAAAWTTVALLMAANFMAYLDRSVLSLAVGPIKHALQLSDTKIGLLHSAFGLFMTLTTFPAGWLADRGNRMRLVAVGVGCWSIMTALCGLCTNFAQLFLARMGVAIGEATMTPTAPSLIADNFPPERRTLPLNVYTTGAGAGLGVALIAGGSVAALISGSTTVTIPGLGVFEPWQVIFFVVGLPGVIVSAALFAGREAKRRDFGQEMPSAHELYDVVKARREILIPHFAGVCIYYVHAFANVGWLPAYFVRVHGWSMADVGLKYGTVHLVTAIAGGFAGGWLARVMWRTGRRDANLMTSAILLAATALPSIFSTLMPDSSLSLFLLGLISFLTVGTGGANIAAIQEIIPNRLRGRVTALYFALLALVGGTIGPLLIGLLNDHLFTDERSIGKSLALISLLTVPTGAALVYVAARRRRPLDWIN